MIRLTCLTAVFIVLLGGAPVFTADSEDHLTGSDEVFFLFTDTHAGLRGMQAGDVLWGDFDNDGDLDALITGAGACKSVGSYCMRNDGGEFMPVYPEIGGTVRGAVTAADYDNDGDVDLLFTGSTALETSEPATVLYRNDGGLTFTAVKDAGFEHLDHSSAAWGDYDNDGDADLLLCGRRGAGGALRTVLYENHGSGQFTERSPAAFEPVMDAAVVWTDYDKDGRQDIFLSGYNGAGFTVLYHNDGGGLFTPVAFPGPNLKYADAAFGDLDHDNDSDLVLVGETHSGNPFAGVYLNQEDGFRYKPADLDPLCFPNVTLGDLDADGDLDIVLTGFRKELFVTIPHFFIYQNDGDAGFRFVFNPCYGIRDGNVDLGDYDNDGLLDVLLAGMGTLEPIARIYHNEKQAAPVLPPAPRNLSAKLLPGSIRLKWEMPVKKAAGGAPVTFNVRVGTTPGGNEVVSGLSTPAGKRKLTRMGNARYNTFFVLEKPAVGTYYFSVQAVDHRYLGSTFAQEISFDWVPVELASFHAEYTTGKVVLSWETASETENLGFNIYRSPAENGEYRKINKKLIAGAGNSASGSVYSWVDDTAAEGLNYYQLEDVDHAGTTTRHGPVSVRVAAAPHKTVLLQNYPNPFNQATTIDYSVPREGRITIGVFDVTGKLVRRLVDRRHTFGHYTAVWDGRDAGNIDVPSGVYFVKMTGAGKVRVVKAGVVR